MLWKYVLLACALSFHSLIVFYLERMFLILVKSSLSICPWILIDWNGWFFWWPILRSLCLYQSHKDFLLKVLSFTFRFIFHFELILYMMQGMPVNFFSYRFLNFLATFLKRLCFLHLCTFSKSQLSAYVWVYIWILFSVLLISFV